MADEHRFSRFELSDWRQFGQVDIDLSARLTVLTGENGTGKTTLLSMLGNHFDHYSTFLGTPTRNKKNEFVFLAGRTVRLNDPVQPNINGEVFESFGTLTYSNGAKAAVGVSSYQGYNSPQFGVEFRGGPQVAGLFLDSHRVVSGYEKVESVPPRFNSASEIGRLFREQLRNWWMPNVLRKSPSLLIKEALIAAALYGEGNSAVRADPLAAEVWAGFQEVLSRLLPKSLGFQKLQIDQGEVILETRSGQFALEAVSGGLSAIFELAWQVYLRSRESETFTVCFDEPENHLHPSLQRSLLPSLLDAFPKVNFIVATHSPFVVTSSHDSAVYVLRRDAEGVVNSQLLDLVEQAYTSEEILREVLGVGSTLPIWAEQRFDVIMETFTSKPVSAESISDLASQLREAGLRFSIPQVVESIADSETAADGK